MMYRNPTPPQPLVLSQNPPKVHQSLIGLHAWRCAQLLTVLPKRETEASFWQDVAQHAYEGSVSATLDSTLGSLASLKGMGEKGNGLFIDNSTRRVIPCEAPLMQE